MNNNANPEWSNHSIDPESDKKWYNVEWKLFISLMIWPVAVYGVYKTDLMSKKTKQLICYAIIALSLLIAITNG